MKEPEDEAFEELSLKQGQWEHTSGWRKKQILETSMTQDAFKAWWYNEGSQAPYTHHDCEEHTMRMCEIAWANGADKEREACARIVEVEAMQYAEPVWAFEIVNDIRARGE